MNPFLRLLLSALCPLLLACGLAAQVPRNLEMQRGDSRSFAIATTWNNAAFTDLASASSVLFTAKRNAADKDSAAVFQKALGYGITVSTSTATVAIVPADTASLTGTVRLFWDLQAQMSDGAIRTVARGELNVLADMTRETTTSVPVYTSEPPVPGGGGGGGSGTVTSVAVTVPSGFAVSGSPVSTAGTIAISFAGGQTANRFFATPNGSTGAASLRAIVAGDLPDLSATYQPKDAGLTSIGGVSTTGRLYYLSAVDTWSAVTIGSGLDFTGGTLTWDDPGALVASANLSDVGNVSLARDNLGLGSAATKNTGTTAGTVAAGDHAHSGPYTGQAFTLTSGRLLGRTTALAGAAEEISVSTGLTLSGGSLSANAGSTSAAGIVELATDGETASGVAVQGNDARLVAAKRDRATFVFDGGGSTVVAAEGDPWWNEYATTVVGWEITGDTSGTATFTVSIATPSGSSLGTFGEISGTGDPAIGSSGQRGHGTDFSGWSSAAIPAGRYVRADLTGSPTGFGRVKITLLLSR